MRRGLALAIAAAIASLGPGLTPRASAIDYGKFPCDNFQKNEDGSWLVLKNTFMEGPRVYLQEDNIITPGRRLVNGQDLAETVAKACPNAPVGQSAAAMPTITAPAGAAPVLPAPAGSAPVATARAVAAPVPARPPLASLSRYADANGSIEVEHLTCGQLDDASTEESDLLLAWYSGWYKGPAKRRTINMARLRYEIRGVVDYCKANRDKSLVKVMDQMLK
jgi:hypothetical protein